ncbi:MAG: protein translocase subunit SecD [Deltaproteobacteria bacterium]|nr:protein translocase subunit SecD [Deltaproteobacteria bacterium]MCW5805349.1 protein translocase subunit SecD [Deltaproteobacteria bacterium]
MSLKWRTVVLIGGILACFAVLLPNFVDYRDLPWPLNRFRPLSLGLDLRGGSRIVYTIDLDQAVEDRAAEVRRDLETRYLEDAAMTVKPTVRTPPTPLGALSVFAPEGVSTDDIWKGIATDYSDTVEKRSCTEEQNEIAREREKKNLAPDQVQALDKRAEDLKRTVCFQVSSSFAEGIRKSALSNAVNTIRERIDEKGVAEPSVVQQDESIVVEMPGLDDDKKQETRDIIARTAKLEFKTVDDGSAYMRRLYQQVGKLPGSKEGEASDPAARELGISAEIDQWKSEETGARHMDPFLMARDRKEQMPRSWADKHGCPDKVDLDKNKPTVECRITGRQLIERYIFGDKDLNIEGLVDKDHSWAVPDDRQLAFELDEPHKDAKNKEPFWRTYYLERATKLTGATISNAVPHYDSNTNRPVVLLDFNRYGARIFGELTSQIVGKRLAAVLDDKVKSAPVINQAIRGGRASISMGSGDVHRAEREVKELVNVLKTGSLPAPLHEEAVSDLGPTLGRDAIQKTQLSFILGVILVIAIMVGFYRKSGWVAVFAVMFHVLVTLAVMALFGATLTLPGIAALVLSVGMCVDGNILINERIRDELLLGKSVRGAVDLGFSRAFSAILDGQFTIAASAFVLLQYGSGPIKGFAVMMLVGVFTTVATNTWVTRILFDWGIHRKKNATTLSI